MIGLLAAVGASVWGASRALQDPRVPDIVATPEDAARAQQKLWRVVRGGAKDPIVLSEAEVNAFVARNLDPNDLPFPDPLIFLREGDVEVVGQVPLGRLLAESPLALPAALLPERWTARPVWLQVAARAQFQRAPRRQVRLAVRRVTIGEQRLPAVVLRMLFEPARLQFVRVTMPDTVADVRIENGRAVIRPTSSRERT